MISSEYSSLPVLVIIRHYKPFRVKPLFQSVFDAGYRTIEITMNTPDATLLIEEADRVFGTHMSIGAGTVLTKKDVSMAMDAGAQFIVSPVFNKKVVEYCVKKNIPVIPGVATPTEAYEAQNCGASMVKLFPASHYGPSYIKQIKAPLDNLKILAVGGVNTENVTDYLEAGADAVAVGASILKADYVDNENYEAIKKGLEAFKDAI